MEAIGAFGQGMVRLRPATPAPAAAQGPATPPPPATADDIAEMTLGRLFETLKVRHGVALVGAGITIFAAGATAGYAVGGEWARVVAAKNQELAAQRLTSERDACQQEIAALNLAPSAQPKPKQKPEHEPAKPAAWGK